MRLGTSIACGALALALASVPACATRDADREASDALARNQALIVAGNQAYRGGKYELAAKRYAAAAVAKKDDPAAYFGMGMALARLGRIEDARVAYTRSRELARRQPRRRRRTRPLLARRSA
jgi:tetratricopeptide (TPR) repeat protein